MPISDDVLFSLLSENDFLEEAKLREAREKALRENISLYDAILSKDLLTDENLGTLVADYLKLPYINLSKVSIPIEVLSILPESFAKHHSMISFSLDGTILSIATNNPEHKDALENIERKIAGRVHVYFTTKRSIDDAIGLYRKDLQKQFNELLLEIEQAEKLGHKDLPIAHMVHQLIEHAYVNKASDVHIEPAEETTLVRFRIDGVLHDVLQLPRSLHDQVVTRIKVLSRLRTDEHFSAQDGKLKVDLEQEDLDVRVSIVPIVRGEKVVMRLLSSASRQFGLSDLGMSDTDLEKVRTAFNKPYGMILSTGPTGSGKTTSMYAILKILNTREKNIATIEDPVEYEIAGLNQIQVNPKTNLTFAEGLRSLLRQDPDIMYVGEIRDSETADIAINSSLTGHLVLSTLHTNNAATTLPRLFDMGVEPFLVASTVQIVIGQRLIRKICDQCKVSYQEKVVNLNKHIPKVYWKRHFGDTKEIRLYKGKGCEVCHHSGFVGRVGIFEVLVMTESLKELIVRKVDASVLEEKAVDEGMKTMLEDGLDKVQRGITTIEEVLRVTKE